MGEMIGAIAHQWKQPLNVLSMNFQILEMDEFTKEDIEFCIDNGKKQVEYMAKTIDDFRKFLSPDKEMQKFKFSEVIEEIKALFSQQLEVHNIDLQVDGDAIIYGYKNELEQVLMNLIKNSKDAFDEKEIQNKYIHIKVTQKDKVIIEIEDNAGGIPKDILENIFNPYFTTKKDGTGIGLYISKMLLEDMKGDIFVESKDNKTKFTIKLLKG